MKTETNHGTLKYISELILAILYWQMPWYRLQSPPKKKGKKMPFLTMRGNT